MNAAQFHLLVNHLPSIGQIAGICVFAFGFIFAKEIVRKTGAWIILCSAVLVWPASFSGEQAEEVMENNPAVDRNLMHEHEESAEFAFVITLAAALAAASHLAACRWKPSLTKASALLLIAASIVSLAALVNASHKGGQIMHPELRNAQTYAPPANQEGDDD